jgi:hypothetical protein
MNNKDICQKNYKGNTLIERLEPENQNLGQNKFPDSPDEKPGQRLKDDRYNLILEVFRDVKFDINKRICLFKKNSKRDKSALIFAVLIESIGYFTNISLDNPKLAR